MLFNTVEWDAALLICHVRNMACGGAEVKANFFAFVLDILRLALYLPYVSGL